MGTADGTVIGMTKVVDNGDPARRWNLVILGDGYQADQLAQFASDVETFAETMRATAPYGDLWSAINIYRIDVSSTESGAADPVACGDGTPGPGTTPRTYFDSAFCNNGIRRLLTVKDPGHVLTLAGTYVPQAKIVMVLVNSTDYGGSGGSVATASLAPGAAEIALHEIGHSAFGLADEYYTYAGCGSAPVAAYNRYAGPEVNKPNVSAHGDRAANKWRELVAADTPMPTTTNPDCTKCDERPSPFSAETVGAFEGAGYYHCGLYRPQYDCRMRTLGRPYCAVCERVIRDVLAKHMPA